MTLRQFSSFRRQAAELSGVPLRGAILAAAVWFAPIDCYGYIGPGAGFAVAGSGLALIAALLLAIATLALWPLRLLRLKLRRRRSGGRAKARRVIIVGLDGLDPDLVEQFWDKGRLPVLKSLAENGSYSRLQTTLPSLSPVAWSTFQTGVNPGAHNIFDFLHRDKHHLLPQLSSTAQTVVQTPRWKKLLRIPAKSELRLLRKSKPFWSILGSHGIFSTILRVPISYPPEPFAGAILSAMCTPDLRGTLGSFCLYQANGKQTQGEPARGQKTAAFGGEVRLLEKTNEAEYTAWIDGPPQVSGEAPLRLPLKLARGSRPGSALLSIGGISLELTAGTFSDWVRLDFPAGRRRRISGIARFYLHAFDPEPVLYQSPINIDPERPVTPISRPRYFSGYLAKKLGPFSTLGFAEDTWGRNEHALDDASFLQQAYLVHEERERMFFDAVKNTQEGLVVCVFDATDRIQHMFWRYQEPDHPAAAENHQQHANAIPELYQRMDEMLGRLLPQLDADDALFVISDHGFNSFRRNIDLNAWLRDRGLLAVATDGSGHEARIDWSATKAFAVGLSGIFVNRIGRQRWGIVDEREAAELKRQLREELEALVDPATGLQPIRRVYDALEAYRGAYVDNAPDLIIGYNPGYRVSWKSAAGGTGRDVFSDNVKAWSGDHNLDPELIPGVFFSNRRLAVDSPHIADLAPTVLDLFAVPPPPYLEGKVLL